MSAKFLSSHDFQVSKIINAPLDFVYKWCTDFREDDNKITGSKSQRTILRKTNRQVIYVSSFPGERGKPMLGVNMVSLKAPNAWHLDFAGKEDDETGDYRLIKLSPTKTKLEMKFRERYKVRNAPTKKEDIKHVDQIWDKYVRALEIEYRRQQRQ